MIKALQALGRLERHAGNHLDNLRSMRNTAKYEFGTFTERDFLNACQKAEAVVRILPGLFA